MTETDEPAVLFTQRMRVASRKAHSVSDSLVNAKLLVAFTNQVRYGSALSLFFHVFQALEGHMEELSTNPVLQPVAELLPFIQRTPGFLTDLLFLLGSGWQKNCSPPEAVQVYLNHLQALRDDAPYKLLAHFYTQHSAMLAGGQIIRRLARKNMQLPEDKGTCVFEYQTSPSKLRKDWTSAMNAAAGRLSAEQQEEVLKEHCSVFDFNNRIVAGFQVHWTDWVRTLLILIPRAMLLGGAIVVCGLALWAARHWISGASVQHALLV